MTELLQQIINGLSLGAIYALIALGYTMVYGVLRFINFAHSDVFMVGAYAGYFLGPRLGAGTIQGGLATLLNVSNSDAVKGIGKAKDGTKVLVAKADANYAVAKERCDDQTGNAKTVCVKEAKAVQVKALADAKLGKEVGEARKDAASDKLDADYKVALAKCDALAGDAKTACVATAKTSFGKN